MNKLSDFSKKNLEIKKRIGKMRTYEILVRVNTEPDAWKRSIGYLKTATATLCRHPADSTVIHPGFLIDPEIMILAFDGNYLSGFALASSSLESDELLLVETVSSRSASRGVHQMLEITARAGGYEFLQIHALPHAVIGFTSLGYSAVAGEFSEQVLRCANEYETLLNLNNNPERIGRLAKFIRDMIVSGFSTKIPEISFEKKINSLGVTLRKSLKNMFSSDDEKVQSISPMWNMEGYYNLKGDTDSLRVNTDSLRVNSDSLRVNTDSLSVNPPDSGNPDPEDSLSHHDSNRSKSFHVQSPVARKKANGILFHSNEGFFNAEEASSPFSPTSSYGEGIFNERGDSSYRDTSEQNIETFFGEESAGNLERHSGTPFLY